MNLIFTQLFSSSLRIILFTTLHWCFCFDLIYHWRIAHSQNQSELRFNQFGSFASAFIMHFQKYYILDNITSELSFRKLVILFAIQSSMYLAKNTHVILRWRDSSGGEGTGLVSLVTGVRILSLSQHFAVHFHAHFHILYDDIKGKFLSYHEYMVWEFKDPLSQENCRLWLSPSHLIHHTTAKILLK